VGLAKAAQAAEEENAALLRLENSIQNMPELAGASTEAFTDLAASMQDSTKFADDVVVSAEAMLGTFHMTEQQILELTPVVADYAAKFGVDLVTAAKQVGRAVAGSAGALQRNGIVLDETAYAADHFGTVLDALKENAGGFAEQEGQTLSGQMAILKNNMMDLAEGVGVGATEAFSDMAGAVKFITDRFEDLDPAMQSAIGQVATWGAVGLTATGATTFLVGQAMKLAPAFQAIAAVGPRTYAAIANLIVPTNTLTASFEGLAVAETTAAAASPVGWIALAVAAAPAAIANFAAMADKFGELTHLFRVSASINPFGKDGPFGDGVQVIQGGVATAVGALNQMNQELYGTDAAAGVAGQALDELSQDVRDYLDSTFDLPEAQRNLRASFDELFQVLVSPDVSFDDMGAGLQSVAEAMGAVVSAGGNANQTARETIARLRETRDAGLITDGMFQNLRTTILNMPGVHIPVATPGAPESTRQIGELDRGVKGLPPSRVVGIQAMGTGTAISNIDAVKRRLDMIPKNKDVFVNIHTTGSAPVHSAVGRTFPLGGVSVVGERGPELVSIPAGGRVFSSTESRMRMRQANKGGGQRMLQPVVLTLDGEVVARHIATIDYRDGISRGDDEWG
jgi:hypothetical protein